MLIFDSFSTNVCLRFHRCFFCQKKELFNITYILTKTPRRTKILISPVWNKILKIWDKVFELINWKICILYIYSEYLLHPNTSGSILQTCINFVEQKLKFYHCKGSIIPKQTRIRQISCFWEQKLFKIVNKNFKR